MPKRPEYEVDPAEVAAAVTAALGLTDDALERYHRAGAGQALHAAVSDALALERAHVLLALQKADLSLQDIADVTRLTRSRVQQLIEKARNA